MDDRALIERLIKSNEDLRDEIRGETELMKRALYGDEQNGVKGLVQLRALDDERITKMEEFKKRILWVWGAIVTLAIGGWELAGDHIKGLFK